MNDFAVSSQEWAINGKDGPKQFLLLENPLGLFSKDNSRTVANQPIQQPVLRPFIPHPPLKRIAIRELLLCLAVCLSVIFGPSEGETIP